MKKLLLILSLMMGALCTQAALPAPFNEQLDFSDEKWYKSPVAFDENKPQDVPFRLPVQTALQAGVPANVKRSGIPWMTVYNKSYQQVKSDISYVVRMVDGVIQDTIFGFAGTSYPHQNTYYTTQGKWAMVLVWMYKGHGVLLNPHEDYDITDLPTLNRDASQPYVWDRNDIYNLNVGQTEMFSTDYYNHFIDMMWYSDDKFQGKTVTYYVLNNMYDQGAIVTNTALGLTTMKLYTVEIPTQETKAPTLMDPMMCMNSGNDGEAPDKIMIPWTSSQPVVSYQMYLDGKRYGQHVYLDEPAYSGVMYVDIADTVRQLFMAADVSFNNSKKAYSEINSAPVTIPAFHGIYNADVKYAIHEDGLRHGDFSVTWNVAHADATDILPNDMFLIYRAAEEDFSDQELIASVSYEEGKTNYEYIDSSDVVIAQTPSAYYYKIARAAIASTWEGYDTYLKEARMLTTADISFDMGISVKDQTQKTIYGNYDAKLTAGDGHKYTLTLTVSSAVDAQLYQSSRFVISDNRVRQPYVKSAEAYATDDWDTSRKVKIRASAGREGYATGYVFTYDHMDVINPLTSQRQYIYYNDGETDYGDCLPLPYYWDTERAPLYLVRQMISDKDTVEVEIPVPADSIRYNPVGWRYEINVVDEASVPCLDYRYFFRVDTTQSILPLPLAGNPRTMVNADSRFYFNDGMRMDSIFASDRISPDFTVLRWTTANGNFENYEIYRNSKVDGTGSWNFITSTTDLQYIDRKAPIGKPALYKVVGTLKCGNLVKDSLTVVGTRDCYGSVSGTVTYQNGAACAGVKVVAEDGEGKERICVTDANGGFYIDSLFFSEEGAFFNISAIDGMNSVFKTYSGGELPLVATLNGSSAIITGVHIVNTSSSRFEGRILYEHSTLPVPDVQFMVNDKLLVNSAGEPMTTDANGNFDLMVQSGYTTIQAVKEGHTFANKGFFTDENGNTRMDLNNNVYGQRLYDQTRITLIGRVTGGEVEGSKPLGKGLSVNTVGDDITLVFELEGDNISHFIHYPTNPDLTQESSTFYHMTATPPGKPVSDSTTMTTYQKRIVVHPDVHTGEYQISLFPAKYKITQVTAKGYSTLFPAGTTSQTLDLTNAVQPIGHIVTPTYMDTLYYNATYSVIYRAPVSVTCQQLLYGMPQDYMGEEKLDCMGLGTQDKVSLVIRDENNKMTGYRLGYPLFESGKNYQFRISAHEDYYYNNDKAGTCSQVILKGNALRIYNGLSTTLYPVETTLDATTGYAIATLPVNNPTFAHEGEDALRQLEISVLVNGEYIMSDPLRAFVSGSQSKGSDYMTVGGDILPLDVIRDPQGANSFAYIEKGTEYSAKYSSNLDVTVGVEIGVDAGFSYQNFAGLVTAPLGAGAVNGLIIQGGTTFPLTVTLQGRFDVSKEYNYSFTTNERISTSSDPLFIGADADVYLGAEVVTILKQQEQILLVDSATFRTLQPMLATDRMRVLSAAKNADLYLIALDELGYGNAVKSTFAYTQHHIINVIFPELVNTRNSMLRNGTAAELQLVADQTGENVYRSLVDENDAKYGLEGGYEVISPAEKKDNHDYSDKIKLINARIIDWYNMIYANEKVKYSYLNRTPDMSYDMSSDVTRSYSETANTNGGSNWFYYGPSSSGASAGGSILASLGRSVGNSIAKAISAWWDNKKGIKEVDVYMMVLGTKYSFHFQPVFVCNSKTNSISTTGNIKTAGFTLSLNSDSHEIINVYRITNTDYNNQNKEYRDKAYGETGDKDKSNRLNADYVFLRPSGATRNPYEPAETTIFYMPGTILSPATLKMDNPTISIDHSEAGNVPADQPATFVLTLSNESELSDNIEFLVPTTFMLKQIEGDNPDGLVIKMDGELIKNGVTFALNPGQSIKKTIQVWRGTAYDYEDVKLYFYDSNDYSNGDSVRFTVRYMPSSCPVTLSLPVQNWILNTLSPKDESGYYIPVEITGFDVNYDGFDHIDLQYKLKTQSDDNWTTQCSYFADSTLYLKASGEKAMIVNGKIQNVKFYGERDPMEQNYDLRAVAYCRFGSGFLTRTSEVRSGLKDTRLPQLFGSVTPANGILKVGDYISIPFSENIAANYLDEDLNFEITGYTNSSSITTSTSLSFSGEENSFASTQLKPNLMGWDFSIDMMVNPAVSDREMTYFAHGNNDTYFGFGQIMNNGNLVLGVYMANHETYKYVISRPVSIPIGEWSHVAFTYDHNSGQIQLYLNGENVTEDDDIAFTNYNGIGCITVGGHHVWPKTSFKGKMLELRVWGKTLTRNEIQRYSGKQLSGYETSLLVYYPFNEGRGTMCTDKASGYNIYMNGQTWSRPEGRSLDLAGNTLRLNGQFFPGGITSDFSYTMWFRVPHTDATVNLFNAGSMVLSLSSNTLAMVDGTMEQKIDGAWMDNEWHFLAVTANHAVGRGSVYVDGKLMAVYGVQHIQGPSDLGEITIGPMRGQIDDITYWELALPDYYVQNFYTNTPNDKEMGLLTHLSFSERVLADDGSKYITQYCPYNQRIRYNTDGSVLARTEEDRVVLNDDKEAGSWLSENAPVRDKGDLVKLGFNWIGKDNELVINLKMMDKEINKQNVFVTVRNVEDLAGNPQANPMSWTIFVDRNQLRWSEKYLKTSISQGQYFDFEVDVINEGGTTMNYTISDLPWWLTIETQEIGELSPQEQKPLRLLVSDKLNPGNYSALIYLTDENELSEPLSVNVEVKAIYPDWWENLPEHDGQTMNMFAQVLLKGANGSYYYDTDVEDLVSAYLGDACIAVSNLVSTQGQTMLCLSLPGSSDPAFVRDVKAGKGIVFMLWRASTGKIYTLNTSDGSPIAFMQNTTIGTPENPVMLYTTEQRTQEIPVSQGWNWISFYIQPNQVGSNFAGALSGYYRFAEGDFVKCRAESQSFEYGLWLGNPIQFDKNEVYMFRLQTEGRLAVRGTELTNEQRFVRLGQNWNYLPYLCETNQEITTALAGYASFAQTGDIVKSYNEFAMLDSRGRWVGSLTHMKPGVGYMLYRQGKDSVTMFYQPEINVPDGDNEEPKQAPSVLKYSTNMPVVATVTGAVRGDVLTAYCGNEVVGTASADSEGRFIMMTSAKEGSMLRFEYTSVQGTQTSKPLVTYSSGKPSVGTVDSPYLIELGEDIDTTRKLIIDQQVVIIHNGDQYSAAGQKIK